MKFWVLYMHISYFAWKCYLLLFVIVLDLPKKSKKGSQSPKKKKLELILDVPILVDDFRDKEKEMAYDFFFMTYQGIGVRII